MARDYSSRRNNPPNKNGKRKPAARPARPKQKPKPRKTSSGHSAPPVRAGAPGCIWLLCAIFLGIAGLSAYYIASRPAGHGPESVSVKLPNGKPPEGSHNNATPSTSSPSTADSGSSAGAGQNHPRFSFYKMLPNYKVEVPAGQQQPATNDNNEPHEAEPTVNKPAPHAPSHSASQSASHSNSDVQSAQSSSPGTSGSGYVIQAGAFSTEGDADQRKAQLALLGVTTNIVDVQTSSGKTVYRVQSSVLQSSDTAHSLAQRLQSHGIETMVRQAH